MLVHQLEIFGTGSGHVSGREGFLFVFFFFKEKDFILKVALFSLPMIWLNLKLPQSKMLILNLIDIFPPGAIKMETKAIQGALFKLLGHTLENILGWLDLFLFLGAGDPKAAAVFCRC